VIIHRWIIIKQWGDGDREMKGHKRKEGRDISSS
jgi:hypothetical protein